MMAKISILLCLCVVVGLVSGYGEPDPTGRPVWQDRANHYFVNAVRISPSGYKSTYMVNYSPSVSSILGSKYPAVPPVYLISQLCDSSYAHSLDMGTTDTFSHNSSDGTSVWTRIEKYYTCSGTMGENIAAGYSSPLDTNNQWLCDETGSACAVDGSGNDGHRSNIMSSSYEAIGVGYDDTAGSTYTNYWTQDFGGTPCSPDPTNPIYSGSHYISGTSNKFLSVFYYTTAASSANLVIAGTSYALSLELGTTTSGTWVVTETTGSACRSYYFVFTAGSSTFRYPDTGCLVTYGEGSCTTSFDASCTGNSGTAATSAATTTTAATSAATTTTAKAATTSTTTTAKAATTTTTTTTTAKAATTTTTTTTTAKAATTTTTTTAKATTGSGSTTGSSSGYFIYSTSYQNSWSILDNSGVTTNPATTYSGQACMSVTIAGSGSSSTDWFGYYHSATVSTASWTSLKYTIASSVAGSVAVFFDGGYAITQAVSTTWAPVTVALSSFGSPANIGGSTGFLVFENKGTAALTLYLYNVELS